MAYKLRASLHQHKQDVRAISILSNDRFVTASHDKTVCFWEGSEAGFQARTTFSEHDGFVKAVATYPSEAFPPDGLVVSGGADNLIMAYAPMSENAQFTLIGHEENVCALATHPASKRIISGSWDKTAIVWKDFQIEYVLKGHKEAVWAVLAVDDDTVLTGSADKTIRLWKHGKEVWSKTGHTDVVRGLALVPNGGFVSCSNDGTLCVWNWKGEVLQTLVGHTSFVYSVAVLSTGEFVSSGEDRTVRVWKDGECIQTIQMPYISVWSVAVLPNDDIIVGGSDAVVFVFTRAERRMASAEEQGQLEELIASQSIPSNQMGGIDKEKVLGPEALGQPGKKDGQVIMVNVADVVEAHQWDSSRQGWQKIGEVVGGNKQIHDGEEYDHVFDIDIEDGQPPLKLPYNVTQNPNDAAQKFIIRHNLPQDYHYQIVDFITKNTTTVELGNSSSTYVDPFTGGGRYVPQQTAPSDASFRDPFTGASSYQPSGTPTPKKPRSAVLPRRQYSSLKDAEMLTKATEKFNEFRRAIDGVSVESESESKSKELATFSEAIRSQETDEVGLQVVIDACKGWPKEKRLPALDLLRLAIPYMSTSVAKFVPDGNIVHFLSTVGGLSEGDISKVQSNAMLAYRGLVNLFEGGESFIQGNERLLLDCIRRAEGFKGVARTHKALSSLALNFAVYLTKKQHDLQSDLMTMLCKLLREETDQESLHHLTVAVGTLIFCSDVCRRKAKDDNLQNVLKSIQPKLSDSNVTDEIRELIK